MFCFKGFVAVEAQCSINTRLKMKPCKFSGTSEPEILEFCPESTWHTIVLGSGWWGFNTVTEDLPTSTAVNPMLMLPVLSIKKYKLVWLVYDKRYKKYLIIDNAVNNLSLHLKPHWNFLPHSLSTLNSLLPLSIANKVQGIVTYRRK